MSNLIYVFLTLLSVVIAIYSWYCSHKLRETLPEEVKRVEESLLAEVKQAAVGLRDHVDEELEPLQKNVNRAFGFKAQQSAATRRLNKAEKMVMRDALDAEAPEIMAALEFLSPDTLEYVEEHPDLIPKLLPRLKALWEVSDGNPMEIFQPGQAKRRPHPFGSREE